jgi:hypothetical protein
MSDLFVADLHAHVSAREASTIAFLHVSAEFGLCARNR